MSRFSFFITCSLFFLFSVTAGAFASTELGTIDPNNEGFYKAQFVNDTGLGNREINFGKFSSQPSYNISVTDTELRGFAWSEVAGWIVLNCADTTSGCSSTNGNFKVANDGEGHLSGYAWGETTGWINFGPFNNSATTPVTINNDGEFAGYAWSQNFGWIVFDCGDSNSCAVTDYRPNSTTQNDNEIPSRSGWLIQKDPPRVYAGVDQSLYVTQTTTNLFGEVYDPNNDLVRYEWKVKWGRATLVSPMSLTTEVIGLTPGTYIFELTAVDERGLVGSDKVMVVVRESAIIPPSVPYNPPPVVPEIPTIPSDVWDNYIPTFPVPPEPAAPATEPTLPGIKKPIETEEINQVPVEDDIVLIGLKRWYNATVEKTFEVLNNGSFLMQLPAAKVVTLTLAILGILGLLAKVIRRILSL